MRAAVCSAWGEVESLEVREMPVPEPGEGEVAIRVAAAGVNYADAIMIAGKYQTRPAYPFVPGLEAAGEVTALGPGCERLAVGDRVMAILWWGGYGEVAVARETETFAVPEGMTDIEAAAFPTAWVSSHVAIRWQADLKAGETMLVLGAAGGVGLAAVECGKALGARVIAAASSPERLALAAQHGADEGIDYSAESLKQRVAELTDGRGVDVVYDPVGGPLFDEALSSLAWGGRILLIGFVAGVPRIPANRLLVKHRSAMGSSMRYFRRERPDLLLRSMEELAAWYREGKVTPRVTETWSLEDVPKAIRRLTDRQATGKVVVTL